MNIVFKNNKGLTYIVTDINYGSYKNMICANVRGGYGSETKIDKKIPAKLFKCRNTGRPCLYLSGKMYTVNPNDDKFFKKEILDKADLK